MPTKSKPFKANQRASSLLPASAKSFVSPFPPGTVRRQRLLYLSSASSRGIHTRSIIFRKSAHHLYIKRLGAGGGGKRKEAKQTD